MGTVETEVFPMLLNLRDNDRNKTQPTQRKPALEDAALISSALDTYLPPSPRDRPDHPLPRTDGFHGQYVVRGVDPSRGMVGIAQHRS